MKASGVATMNQPMATISRMNSMLCAITLLSCKLNQSWTPRAFSVFFFLSQMVTKQDGLTVNQSVYGFAVLLCFCPTMQNPLVCFGA